MNSPNLPKDAHADVVAELVALREACGTPTLQQICDISEQLGQVYGAEYGLRPLSVNRVWEMLKGTRKPRWESVRTFVLACNRYRTVSTCGSVADPGVDALPYWLGRLSTAAAPVAKSAESAVFTVISAPPESAPHPHRELALRVLRNRGLFHPDPYDGRQIEPVELDALLMRLRIQTTDPLAVIARRYRDWFQHPHVIELLEAAHGRDDPEAAGRLAVLLICAGHPDEAQQWLEQAIAAGEVIAIVLSHAQPAYRRGVAAELAYELAMVEGNADGDPVPGPHTAAEVYGQVAARCGHPGATYWLADRHDARGDVNGAAYWYTTAAAQGHTRAEGAFEDIHQAIWARTDPTAINMETITDEWETGPAIQPPTDHPG